MSQNLYIEVLEQSGVPEHETVDKLFGILENRLTSMLVAIGDGELKEEDMGHYIEKITQRCDDERIECYVVNVYEWVRLVIGEGVLNAEREHFQELRPEFLAYLRKKRGEDGSFKPCDAPPGKPVYIYYDYPSSDYGVRVK